MTFDDYQKEARKFAIYPDIGASIFYPTLGLCGETGEVAEKVKKIFRDEKGIISPERVLQLKKELGDVLWYISNLASELGLSLKDIASGNIQKLQKRKDEGKIKGSGDNR